VLRGNTPPIVGKGVENAQNDDKESGRPFSFETNGDHTARSQTEDRDEEAGDTPLSLDNEAKEQEYEQYAASKKKTACNVIHVKGITRRCLLFSSVCFTESRKSSKELLPCHHRIAEHHEQSANDAQVAQEEGEVENETVTETLNDDYAKETSD
jgi:hypothetical protein